MRASRARRRSSRGFALVETMVVLLILGGVLSIWLSAARPLRERSLLVRFEASLTSLVHRARAQAVRDGLPVRLLFDLEERRIRLEGSRADAVVPAEIVFELTSAVELGTGSERVVLFLPDGSSSGGQLRIGIARAPEGSTKSFNLSWASGALRVDRRSTE